MPSGATVWVLLWFVADLDLVLHSFTRTMIKSKDNSFEGRVVGK